MELRGHLALQVGYFGLFVDGSFERGMSRPAATFENPCLASAETFEVDIVECWRVQPPTPEELEEAAREAGSVLDKYGLPFHHASPFARLCPLHLVVLTWPASCKGKHRQVARSSVVNLPLH